MITVEFQSHTLIFCKESLELFNKYHPYWMINKKANGNYLYCSHSEHKNKPFHRILMGFPPCDVDHVNNNGLDNRKLNLRLATRSQNAFNTKIKSSNTSGYKGVSFCKLTGKWVARIRLDGTYKNLGRFDTPEKAHEAYCIVGKQHLQEFFCDGSSI